MSTWSYGRATLRIAGLKIWVSGRQHPELHDYWDGNWLQVSARCTNRGSSVVEVEGPILHVTEIAALLQGCESMYATLSGSAMLDCIEPNLFAELSMKTAGHVATMVRITPDHLAEAHTFHFEIDQSYLPAIIRECRGILKDYPVRGSSDSE